MLFFLISVKSLMLSRCVQYLGLRYLSQLQLQPQLEFRGEWIDSYIDGSKMRYFSSALRTTYVYNSIGVVGALMMLVVGIVVSIYVIRFTITPEVGDSNAQTIASVANAVQIQVLNYIYSSVAHKLTERENRRYKKFSFVFSPINSIIF
jgi:hypothetical protein